MDIDINIPDILDREAEKRIKQYPHPNNRASEGGHPCERFLVLSRLQIEKKELHDVGLQRIFDEGNLQERAVMRELEDAGFQVVEQQRSFSWKKFKLSGHIDGKIAVDGSLIPLEIKSCSPNVFQSLKNLKPEDFIHSKYPWIRKYPAQIMLYMLMDGKETGIMLFKNKTTGEKLQFTFHLDYDYTEAILKKLERVNDYVAKGEIPETQPSEECQRCGFFSTACFPGQDYGPGFEMLSDAEAEALLIRREELEKASKEYKEIDKRIKDQFKGRNAVVGEFVIESKEYERRSFNIPDEVKQKYQEIKKFFKTSIKKI